MIDFKNSSYLKLRQVKIQEFEDITAPLLVDGEHLAAAYKSVRDGVVFTNKRVISVNVQGVTGKKRDFTSLPYSKVTAFSVETSGVFDLDSELDLWFSGLGKVVFEFTGKCNIT
ncbi:MAG TPA: cytoplasmic protein, partial [Ruminococcaceae bacterium]|nr:cytoplasmic protein [Oscillospiraceae bacterium]